jgi:hypothetical protein
MVYFGYADAQLCRGGPDAGIDISSTDAVAQVKAGETPTGRPVVQQLSGIAGQVGKRPVLFTVSGVTDEAREWADKAGIALFQLSLAGQPRALNPPAQEMMAHAEGALAQWQAVTAELESLLAAGEEASITATFTAPDGTRGFWGIWIDRGGVIRVARDVAGATFSIAASIREAVAHAEALVDKLGATYADSQPVITVAGASRPFEPRLKYPE